MAKNYNEYLDECLKFILKRNKDNNLDDITYPDKPELDYLREFMKEKGLQYYEEIAIIRQLMTDDYLLEGNECKLW